MELQLNTAGLGPGRMETFSRTGPGVKQDPPHLVQWKSETIWQGLRQHETLCSQINEACVSHRIASGKKGLMAFFSGCRDKKRTAIGWAVFRCGGRYASENRPCEFSVPIIHASTCP